MKSERKMIQRIRFPALSRVLIVTVFGLSVLTAQLLTGCKANNTTKGGAIGAGVGGAVGGVIGSQSDNTAVGAIIGATIGGAAGALIGRHMDKQAEELEEDLEGATVERIGEGIKITFDSGLLFDVDSHQLRAETQENLNELAGTLQKYDNTNILIEGHTDETGSDEHNLELSKERAAGVEDYLTAQGVKGGRIDTEGYGEHQPTTSNETASGRQQNRRVEVAIFASEKMKKMARNGELEADAE